MRKLLLMIALLVVCSAPIYAQNIQAVDPVTGGVARPGNSARQSLNVANPLQEAIDTNIQNSLSLIDDTVYTFGAVPTISTSKGLLIGGVRRNANTTFCATDGCIAPFQFTSEGFVKVAALSGTNIDVATDAIASTPSSGPLLETERDDALSTGAVTGSGRNSPLKSNPNGAAYVTNTSDAAGATWKPFSVISVTASTNGTNAKNAPGNLYGVTLINSTTVKYFIKFYNTSSTPTCSNAAVFILEIPPNDSGISPVWPGGVGFTTGISYCIVATGTLVGVGNADVGITGVLLYY